MGCAWEKWYDWDTTGCGPDANWDSLYYYFDNIVFTGYWFESHQVDWRGNTTIALKLLKDKIDELGAPPELNMDSILSAMITADFGQLQYFVGLVDAYRMALWNQPFNAEFYAALARGFML